MDTTAGLCDIRRLTDILEMDPLRNTFLAPWSLPKKISLHDLDNFGFVCFGCAAPRPSESIDERKVTNDTIITMNIDQNTGEVVNQGRSPRFTLWVAFLAFSTITMGSAVGVVRM